MTWERSKYFFTASLPAPRWLLLAAIFLLTSLSLTTARLTAQEQTDLSVKLDALENIFLSQTEQSKVLAQSLQERERLLTSYGNEIETLRRQLADSDALNRDLQDRFNRIEEQFRALQKEHGKVLQSFAKFETEAKSQIQAVQEERDREAKKARRWRAAGIIGWAIVVVETTIQVLR